MEKGNYQKEINVKMLKDIKNEKIKKRIIRILEKLGNIKPCRITNLDENDACLVFDNNNIITYVELYHDADLLGVIIEDSKNKRILKNEDITESNLLTELKRHG